jgi:pyridoxal phosphate enzyme (YggS family)
MTNVDARTIEENLGRVRERVAAAAARSGRDSESVTLVAVSKTFPAEAIAVAWSAGVVHFGENRVEEGLKKIPAVASALGGRAPVWHMVGHVQSRKARDVAEAFDYVDSVDSVKLAARIGRFAHAAGRDVPVLLECNVSGEETKFGFDVSRWAEDPEQRDAFYLAVEEILGVEGISVQGLMTMAPLADDPEDVRPVFGGLRSLLKAVADRFPGGHWRHLSMGMTDDFEVAVEEGATMLRIGRAIFGSRRG